MSAYVVSPRVFVGFTKQQQRVIAQACETVMNFAGPFEALVDRAIQPALEQVEALGLSRVKSLVAENLVLSTGAAWTNEYVGRLRPGAVPVRSPAGGSGRIRN